MPSEQVDECAEAIQRLKNHPDNGALALDVLSHITTGTQDPEVLGIITSRINVSIDDKARSDARFRQIQNAYNPVTGDGDMTLDRSGNYKGVH